MRPLKRLFLLLTFSLLLAGCAAPATETALPPASRTIDIYASPAARPWLSDFFACARAFPAPDTTLRSTDDPSAAAVRIQLGEPGKDDGTSYQIGSDDLLVVTHRQNLLQNLDAAQTREIFSGRGLPAGVQVWVYAAGEDIQRIFQKEVLGEAVLSSLAKLATDPQQMSDTLNSDPNAVGILPRRWKMGDSRIIFTLANLPVLALTSGEPDAALRQWMGCMQEP